MLRVRHDTEEWFQADYLGGLLYFICPLGAVNGKVLLAEGGP
jgi:hypothetical protein